MSPNPLTLKQRLAALSANIPNVRPNPDAIAQAPTTKRRPFLGRRHSQSDAPVGAQYAHEKVQDVMNKLIFQAGVDYETRPMVVMNAAALPDPREVSYDVMLDRILGYLNLYVESDYTVVFFAAGGRHTPGWNWVWKAYRSLSRKYRKNLKRLFIVHSNFFTKMLFSLAGSIISPKFFRKITYITTLSELACHVPLTQIDIHAAVYHENLKHERQITLPVLSRANLFGVPLEELMGYDGEKGGIPRVVKDCIQYLRHVGLEEEGIFRRSPNSAMLKQAQQAYDRGNVVSLESFVDPHLAAVLLKKYLRDLPTPIFMENSYPFVLRCPAPANDSNDMSSISYIRETILPQLPHCAYILLSNILQLLHEVSLRSDINRMDAHNLSVVITPNLVSSPNPLRDVMMCAIPSTSTTIGPSSFPQLAEGKTTLGMVIKLCIHRYYEVFDEVQDRSEAMLHHALAARDPSPPSHLGRHRDSVYDDDDDNIDDAMLVMPIGPIGSAAARNSGGGAPPTAWGAGTPAGTRRESGGRSMHSAYGASGNGSAYATVNKARSTISIERGDRLRSGSIAVGRGTTRKSSGAGVEAIGITASGFFTAPESAPPVPTLPPRS